ncbi:MAG: tyrosine-protein phosphatase [Clostridia bacterium]|nr:tyrosine-protein phosphatase [Clostridia bacterium]
MKKKLFGSRLLALVLTLAMVVSCAGVIPALIASATDPSFDGYLYNGDFETGDMSNWTTLYGNMSVVEGGHNGSGYCLRVAGSKWACIYQQSVQVQPNTNYRLSGWVKRESGTGAHYLYAKTSAGDSISAINGTKQYFKYTGSEWVYHKWEFNSGSNTSIEPRMTIEDPDSVFLYDDIVLEPIPTASNDGYISNGDFELGEAGAWTMASTCSVIAGGHDGSGYCVRVAGSAWSKIHQDVTVEPNTNYRLSAWVKREAGTGAHYCNAKGATTSTLETLNKTSPWHRYVTPDWTWHVWDFNSGDNTKINVRVDIEDAASVVLYDDITIRKLSDDSVAGYITNAGFEAGKPEGWELNSLSSVVAGGYGGSAYALRQDGAGKSTKQYIRVEPVSDYRISAKVKRVSGTGRHQIRVQKGDNVLEPVNGTTNIFSFTSGDWEDVSFEINTGRTTQITLFLGALDGGSIFLYDDITVEQIVRVEPDYSNVIKGDVDLDGDVDADDLELIRDLGVTAEGAAKYAADMNCDGIITSEDLQALDDFLAMDESGVMALYPTQGETVANAAWQIDELLKDDYYSGKSDEYSGVYYGFGTHVDQYARDPVVLRWASRAPHESYTVRLTDEIDAATGIPDFTNAYEYVVQGTELSLQNLPVDTWYFWSVDAGGEAAYGFFYTEDTLRTLLIDGVTNTRDLGGWKTSDGKYRVKYGIVYRGAELEGITAEGLEATRSLGIKTDVDLRGRGSNTQSPLGADVQWWLSGEYGAAMYYNSEKTTISDLTSTYVQGTANAIRAFANPDNYPIYFHCTYGRDRTGTLALLLLGLVGVTEDQILRDYEITFLTSFAGGSSRTIKSNEGVTKTTKWLIDNYAPGGTLKDACEGYLLAIGVTADEIAAIRGNLLELADGTPIQPDSIEITTLPRKLSFLEGKGKLNVIGGVLTVHYTDGTTETVNMTVDMVSNFDNTVTGPQTLTVTYGGLTTTYDIEITPKSLESIAVTVLPAKLEYEEGEEFDPTGMEITAYYDNDTQEVLGADAYELSGFDSASVGEKTVTVSVDGITTTFAVNVIKKVTPGDADGDGEVTVTDALAALRAALGLAELDNDSFRAADVDGDGAITVSDALRILRIAAGINNNNNSSTGAATGNTVWDV